MLEQIWRFFSSLSSATKIFLGVAAVIVISLFVVMMALWQPASLSPLFTELAPTDAARIVEDLKSEDIAYRLVDGGKTILVPTDMVPEVRIGLAGKGLPSIGVVGFEIFDKAKMGITETGMQIDYKRALEGELTRTFIGFDEIASARVHIVMPREYSFLSEPEPASASVVLHLESGTRLASSQVKGVVHLIVHAVENLSEESVTVTDGRGNLLYGPTGDTGVSDEQLAYKRRVERDLEDKVVKILEKVYGKGMVAAAATVQIDFSHGSLQSENYSPVVGDQGIVTSESLTETTKDGTSSGGSGVPGTTSNIPGYMGTIGAGSTDESETSSSVVREYAVNREVISTEIPGGSILSRSISIVITDSEFNDIKRQEAELLVASAIGANIAAGDKMVVTGKPPSAELEPIEPADLARAARAQRLQDYIRYAAVAVFVIFALLIMRGIANRIGPDLKLAFEGIDIKEEIPSLDFALTAAEEEEVEDVIGVRRITEAPRTKQQQIKEEIIQKISDDPTEIVRIIRNWFLED